MSFDVQGQVLPLGHKKYECSDSQHKVTLPSKAAVLTYTSDGCETLPIHISSHPWRYRTSSHFLLEYE